MRTSSNNKFNIIPPQLQTTTTTTTTSSNINNQPSRETKTMEPYWSEAANGHAPHSVKYESEAAVSSFPYCTESSLNFSTSATTYSEDDAEYATGRRNKASRQDPLSHRIIEKRRRDRMNSCLADLSRLIPPQYQRKGRGRIEKTEIIEMAIRHLKHLQSECLQKENEYRMGYTDCMKEAAKFLYDSQMQEFCYRLIARLQEHCDEMMKNECLKSRNCHAAPDNVSGSSGSPHQVYHTAAPLCQLRDMLGTSDIEHSNDHNDVKDLSFRNQLNQLQRNDISANNNNTNDVSSNSINNIATNSTSSSMITTNNATNSTNIVSNKNNNNSGSTKSSSINKLSQQPHQAAVITSTAPASLNHHTDSSNHDFDSSREPLLHTDTSNMHSPPPRDSALHLHPHHHLNNHHHHHHHHPSESLLLQASRMRNFSESSHDIEHNNNYKYKNHIKERFNHELHDEETSSEHCPAPPMLQSEHSHTHSMSEHSKDGTEPDVAPILAKKRKLVQSNSNMEHINEPLDGSDSHLMPPMRQTASSSMLLGVRDEKPFCFSDIKSELSSSTSTLHGVPSKLQMSVLPSSTTTLPQRSFAVPIFALHGQGTYYVPLNVDYSVLVPFLNGLDLLEKNYTSMPVVHPININVNFMPPTPSASLLAAAAAAAAVAAGKQQPPPMNGNHSVPTATVPPKTKLESITNGW